MSERERRYLWKKVEEAFVVIILELLAAEEVKDGNQLIMKVIYFSKLFPVSFLEKIEMVIT
jgi:hypothetical protein